MNRRGRLPRGIRFILKGNQSARGVKWTRLKYAVITALVQTLAKQMPEAETTSKLMFYMRRGRPHPPRLPEEERSGCCYQ